MHLGRLYSKFDSRCRSYNARVAIINASKDTIDDWKFRHLTEVLVSDIWQSWCRFSRELFLSSCRGCTARDGQIIPAIQGDKSWRRLGYRAKQASVLQNATAHGHLNFPLRKEPTWGDLDVFLKVVAGIKPHNYQTLLSSYGSFTSIKHLQLVRNACAHKNFATMTDAATLSTAYNLGKLSFATDVVWKNTLNGREFAVEIWLFEMNLIADLVTSTP